MIWAWLEVKHGVLVHVYNLYTDEVGNPELPAKLQSSGSQETIRRADCLQLPRRFLLAAIVVAGSFVWKWAMVLSRT